MSATLTTNHGTFTGRTIESIIRTRYGRRAHWGQGDFVVVTDKYGTHVLARIIRAEGDREQQD